MEDQQIVALYWARQEAAIEQTAEKYGSHPTTIAMWDEPIPLENIAALIFCGTEYPVDFR